ncbi:UbiX family flavin prenyltransferase [Paenactinomyces guangxiensis]|uniref:Flavin prenyltransferase UbiX n=1 Tax=Paenactinomyces guangxiensis TaxID=1490290 RepID=A0A7W2A9V7_9BACL|nr:flavin prenyltransferase UbiX [Paenactinomyces guangxiensis]MBA4495602.1 UbiX family flavin prenyltransferase [Paenactinomyces guangxiensis]MBH8592590.1 UbiX family flavin prenyltransferase [Paenactinomyces guangxiensis]
MSRKRFIVAMSGASGAPYGLCLLEELLRQGHEVHLVVTEAAWRVLKEEHQWEVQQREQLFFERYGNLSGPLVYHPIKDIGASIASGSFMCDAMVVIPCSMATLAKIAQGISSNLLERSADVMLKERRPLILVPRETPLHSIHLENMLKLSRYGASIVPAMPAFYHQPTEIEEMVRFIAGKVLDLLGVKHDLYRRWEGRQ